MYVLVQHHFIASFDFLLVFLFVGVLGGGCLVTTKTKKLYIGAQSPHTEIKLIKLKYKRERERANEKNTSQHAYYIARATTIVFRSLSCSFARSLWENLLLL